MEVPYHSAVSLHIASELELLSVRHQRAFYNPRSYSLRCQSLYLANSLSGNLLYQSTFYKFRICLDLSYRSPGDNPRLCRTACRVGSELRWAHHTFQTVLNEALILPLTPFASRHDRKSRSYTAALGPQTDYLHR